MTTLKTKLAWTRKTNSLKPKKNTKSQELKKNHTLMNLRNTNSHENATTQYFEIQKSKNGKF